MVVREALEAGVQMIDVFVAAEDRDAMALKEDCQERGAAVLEVGENVLRAVADTATPQGVVAVAEIPPFELTDLPPAADLVLVLAEVRDPGNAGTLVRSAAAAGAGCVIFSEGSVDPFGPKTVRASSGAVFKIPIARSAPLGATLLRLKEQGFTTVGAEGHAAKVVYDVDLRGRSALVLGNEAHGLPREVSASLDDLASIPLEPAVESLNVATAGSIFLFEAVRQRRLSSAPHG